jgi:hypothetical protein
MRRTTAVLLLSISLLAATPSYGADSIDRSFRSRIRAAIHRILSYIGTNGDSLTPPKP